MPRLKIEKKPSAELVWTFKAEFVADHFEIDAHLFAAGMMHGLVRGEVISRIVVEAAFVGMQAALLRE
jgi:hypothetical protein